MRPAIPLTAALLAVLSFTGAAGAAPASAPAALAADLPRWEALRRRADWPALEKDARQALQGLRAVGAPQADVATASVWLADAVEGQGRASEAEPLYREALTIRAKVLGDADPDTIACQEELVLALMAQGRYRDAEPLIRQAVAVSAANLKDDDPRLARGENILGRLLRDRGFYADAEPHFRRALAIRQAALGMRSSETATSLNNLALLLWSEGRFDDAEPLMRQALEIREAVLGAGSPGVALSLNGLALILHSEGRYGEAEPLYRRALAVAEVAEGPSRPDVALIASNLGGLMSDQGRQADATPLFRRALTIRTGTLGAEHPDTAVSLNNLAFSLEAQGQHEEAERLYRQALAVDERVLGDRHPDTAIVLRSIGELYDDEGRAGEAEPLFRRAAQIDERALGGRHPDTADAHQSLAYAEELQARFPDAVRDYRLACDVRSRLAGGREQIGEAASTARFKSSKCSTRLALALRGWFEHGGGAAGERPEALRDEAFVAAQHAALSAAGEAMARSAALAAARSAGVGEEAAAYENALSERETLDQEFAKDSAETGEQGVEHRAALADRRAKVLAQIDALAAELKAKAPLYWDLRAPEPIDIAALQARSGPDARLLKDDEALIMVLTPPGKDKGVVFAVSKTRAAWARIPLTGDELQAKVRAIRLPIEHNYRAFYRQPAYELYLALLGDPAIQAVIAGEPTLLFVPAGPLTSLPPGLLVTKPPKGGTAGDSDQAVLRATPWLLRAKAIALSPSVASLRTLRQLGRVDHVAPTDPLLAFADPDFAGAPAAPGLGASPDPLQAPRSFTSYYNSGHAIADALRSLPPLPGTRVEGQALMSVLDGRPGSLLLGSRASKAELMARNADGRLAQVRVLEFATHGFVAGDATWLSEPALALAAGPRPEDELLLASEASTLKLNADWVLLSACNTASPDAPEAEGLSGLSRAFFFAGARSLLVSHWRVRDDVAARLVPAILLAERNHPGLSRAAALQQASLAALDDPTIRAAHPSAWAPFTLVGEAER